MQSISSYALTKIYEETLIIASKFFKIWNQTKTLEIWKKECSLVRFVLDNIRGGNSKEQQDSDNQE